MLSSMASLPMRSASVTIGIHTRSLLSRRVGLPRAGTSLSQISHLRTWPRSFTKNRDSHLQQEKKQLSFNPSTDQQEIVRLCSSQNVIVSACPGSGKTATAEAIVAANPNKRVGVFTYSKKLQAETQRRLHAYPNCEVHTFHKMAGLLLGEVTHKDAVLRRLIRDALSSKELPRWKTEPFDIIVLDEFQDCTPLLFKLITCFIRSIEQANGGQAPRIVILGDEKQSIYRYRDGDPRYLSLATELLGSISPHPFATHPLIRSFRLSQQTVRFINSAFLGGEACIESSKHGPMPIILNYQSWSDSALVEKLSSLIKEYGPENSAIIAPSTSTSWPVIKLTNHLSQEYRIPIAVAGTDDDAPMDDRVTNGKLCVSTIHQFKGSERGLIILFGMDSSSLKHTCREYPEMCCPNEVYVALTRAATQLVLVHDERKKLMPFVSLKAFDETADVSNMTNGQVDFSIDDTKRQPVQLGLKLPETTTVRNMTRHVRDEDLEGIIGRDLLVRRVCPALPAKEHISIPSVVPSNRKRGFHESVSDINGLVVAATFELDIKGTLETLGLDQRVVKGKLPADQHERISWLCRQACKYVAKQSGYRPRAVQMKFHKYDWIKPRNLKLALSRLRGQLEQYAGNLQFEVGSELSFVIDGQKTKLQGRTDIVVSSDPGGKMYSIWEIKFVSQLSNEHIAQACIYAYLLSDESEDVPLIVLYNARDGEKIEMDVPVGRKGLRRMVESILRSKYTKREPVTDEMFLIQNKEITAEVLKLE